MYCIGSAHKAEHNVYIWDLQRGSLVKMVEGPKETVEDVCVSNKLIIHINNKRISY